MSEMYGVLTPLGAEIKRSIDFWFYGKYNTNKTFKDFFEKSIYKDNLNFLSAIFSQDLINYFGVKKLYFICIAFIFSAMFANAINSKTSFFLKKGDIYKMIPFNRFFTCTNF